MSKEMCCFCGEWEENGKLMPLIFIVNKHNEQQGFMCHKKCFVQNLDNKIMLHPELEKYRTKQGGKYVDQI